MVRNDSDELHTARVTITNTDGIVYQHEYSVATTSVIRREGVVTKPGQYTVKVALDDTTKGEYQWEFSKNEQGVMIRIEADGTLTVGAMPRM
jgi:hypothetical protein